MLNKKRIWLGLVASLTIAPILVATATAQPGGLQPASSVPQRGLPDVGRIHDPAPSLPRGNRPQEIRPVAAEPAPESFADRFKAMPQITLPFFLTGQPGEQKNGEQKKNGEEKKNGEPKQPEQPPTPPQTAASTDPAAAAPFAIYEGLPKLGGAPSAKAAEAQAPAQSTSVTGQSSVNSGGVGDLLSKSNNALGVEVQKRSPLVGDPRIEGLHFGQVVTYADGGYWFPARVDLDTVVSKMNASDIDNILIIKGPYSVRYGPGFSFLDIQSLATPRYKDGCFEAHGSSSINYRTNGQGWQGQQSFWGGNADWGYRISYDLQTAVDYTTGAGDKLPSGYNNQFVNFAYGYNLTCDSSIELRYLHVQQNNVIFPGLLTDINNLTTDAFTGRYVATKGAWYDRFTLETWINTTRFNGDSSNPGTRAQIPQLDNIFARGVPRPSDNIAISDAFGPVRLDLTTNGDSLSYGARDIITWGEQKGFNLSIGTDIKVFSSSYNEFNAFNLSVANGSAFPANFGIPYARQIDPGMLMDMSIPVGDQWNFKAGSRVDFVTSQFLDFGINMNQAEYRQNVGPPENRSHFLFAAFLTGEYKITPQWTAQGGYGYAERPPTLTELYTGGAFLGLIQNGFNSIYGNTQLRKEAMHQLNLGLNANYERFRAGVYGFYAFMPNYITYRSSLSDEFFTVDIPIPSPGRSPTGAPLPPTVIVGTTPIRNLRFANTPSATLFGFDAYTEVDATPYLTPFFTLNFTEGWDQTINEALPGISPLSSRVGFRFHEAGKNPKWGIEYYARMVANQELFAASLGEQRTAGFVTHNLRGYWQARENVLLLAGVENFGDLLYREHLDLRTGTPLTSGVFQPGINFYIGGKLTY